MPRESAGLLCYRRVSGDLEVLLVHPGGPFWANKDDGVWSIPKGHIDPGEEPLDAARREFVEETGAPAPDGRLVRLSPVRQGAGKIVHAWACEADFDESTFRSLTFSMEWPPRSGRHQTFPEIDRAGWFALAAARRKILKGQLPLLEELVGQVGLI